MIKSSGCDLEEHTMSDNLSINMQQLPEEEQPKGAPLDKGKKKRPPEMKAQSVGDLEDEVKMEKLPPKPVTTLKRKVSSQETLAANSFRQPSNEESLTGIKEKKKEVQTNRRVTSQVKLLDVVSSESCVERSNESQSLSG